MCAFERSEKGMDFNMDKIWKIIVGILIAVVVFYLILALTR